MKLEFFKTWQRLTAEGKNVPLVISDGGRWRCGIRKAAATKTGDCVCRAIVHATGLSFARVFRDLTRGCRSEVKRTEGRRLSHIASSGIYTDRAWFRRYMRDLGFVWVSCSGPETKPLRLVRGEMPRRHVPLVLSMNQHYTCYKRGRVYDMFDPVQECGPRIYGYWYLKSGKVNTKARVR